MNQLGVTIKSLSPALLQDFLRFFGCERSLAGHGHGLRALNEQRAPAAVLTNRSTDVSDTEKLVARILDSYKAAVYEKDIEAFMRLYDPNVRVFDTWGVWSYEGAVPWTRAVESWFGSLGTERVKVTFDDVRVLGERDFASVSAIVKYSGLSAQGEQLRAMQNRLTWVLRVSGHVLRIVHEHTSAPVGFEDMKAILERTPAR